MNDSIRVGMADYKICCPPQCISTLGLGSCIGVVIYDTATKWCGLAHIMLPDSEKISNNENRYKFVDTCLADMYQELLSHTKVKENFVAKMAGGARMFAYDSTNEHLNIGDRNILAAKDFLERHSIPLIAEDTGKTYGRTIEFDPAKGMLIVKAVGVGITAI